MTVRLEKQTKPKEEIKKTINKYSGIILLIGVILALILFVVACYLFVPPTDSGLYYNHFGEL